MTGGYRVVAVPSDTIPNPERMCINCEHYYVVGFECVECEVDGHQIGYAEPWEDQNDCPHWKGRLQDDLT